MIEWFFKLPQEKGDYLWMDLDLNCTWCGVVTICEIADYRKSEWVEELRKSKDVYIYKNDAGKELVICWAPEQVTQRPMIDEQGPDVWAWAKFNYPGKHMRGVLNLVPKAMPTITAEEALARLKPEDQTSGLQ